MNAFVRFAVMITAVLLSSNVLAASGSSVAVLMYHKLSDEQPSGMNALTRHTFEQQLEALAKAGYTTVTMSEVADFMNKKISLPPKTVAITFDDGWSDNVIAVQMLNRYKMKATFYIISGALGWPNYLSKSDLIDISKNKNMEIGAHTETHFVKHADHLKEEVSTSMLIGEATISKMAIEGIIGKTVKTFAWPYGYTTKEAFEYIGRIGFTSTALVEAGLNMPNENPLTTKRLNVDGRCGIDVFMKQLETGKAQQCE